MSQTTEIQIQNQNGLSFRTKLNQMLSALNTVFSGTTAPTVTEADMLWMDTSISPNVLKRRNSSNTAWEVCPVVEGAVHLAARKSTPANNDEFAIIDSASGNVLKKILWSEIKAAAAPPASETVPGIVELATSAEAQAFTANKFIDGAKLSDAFKGSNFSLSANGYQKLPSGLIVQWGSLTTSASAEAAFTFPIAFPNGMLGGTATYQNNTSSNPIVAALGTPSKTATNVGAYASSTGARVAGQINVVVIGY